MELLTVEPELNLVCPSLGSFFGFRLFAVTPAYSACAVPKPAKPRSFTHPDLVSASTRRYERSSSWRLALSLPRRPLWYPNGYRIEPFGSRNDVPDCIDDISENLEPTLRRRTRASGAVAPCGRTARIVLASVQSAVLLLSMTGLVVPLEKVLAEVVGQPHSSLPMIAAIHHLQDAENPPLDIRYLPLFLFQRRVSEVGERTVFISQAIHAAMEYASC